MRPGWTWPRIPIKLKLAAVFVLVAIVPMTIVTLADLFIQVERSQQALLDRALGALSDAENTLVRQTKLAERLAALLASEAVVEAAEDGYAIQYFLDETKDFWFPGIVEVFGPDGRLMARSSSPSFSAEQFSTTEDNRFLRKAFDLESHADYQTMPYGLVIKAATPVVDRSTLAVRGAVVVTFPADRLLMHSLKEVTKAEITLQWNDSGDVVSTMSEGQGGNRSRIWFSTASPLADLTSRVARKDERIDGRTYAVAYSPLRDNDGQVVAILAAAYDHASIEAGAKLTAQLILVSATAAAILALALGYLTAKRLTRPIYRLLDAIRFVSRGDLGSRVTMHRNDEIGDVAGAFNEMAKLLQVERTALIEAAAAKEGYARELEESNRRLAGFNEDLERTVRERTEEVERRNLALTREIEEKQRAEKLLRESERRFMDIIQFLPDPTFVIDREGRVIAWNLAMEEISSIPAKEIVGQGDHAYSVPFYGTQRPMLVDLVQNRHLEIERQYGKISRNGDTLMAENYLPDYQGGPIHVWAVAAPLYDSAGNVVGAIESMRDITERVQVEEQLTRHALHDLLTGLPNRKLFSDRLQAVLRRTRRHNDSSFAVFLLDLDRFKLVNDSLGHAIGDRLLVKVAQRITTAVREEDTVSRFGGDEFVILLSDTSGPREIVQVASRIIEALEKPILIDGHEVFTSASVGIVIGSDYAHPEFILRDADIAMYRAKEQGRGRYKIFHNGMLRQAVRRLDVENDLRRAVDRREFILHYQPIVRLDTLETCGVEALVRWNHPRRGLLPPSEFIDRAEETGLIVPLGRIVMEDACLQMRQWADALGTTPMLVSVNLSPRQFSQPDLVDMVRDILANTGLAPEMLRFEVTESVLMKGDLHQAVRQLHHLNRLGISLAIDDFGTGHSSLSHLQKFPLDVLKVDKSFVRDLPSLDGNHQIVRAVLALASGLGLEVVAEGVETEENLAALRALGCQYGQGYYFAKPAPAEETWNLMHNMQRRSPSSPKLIDIRSARKA